MHRISEAMQEVGSDFLFDLLNNETIVFRLIEKKKVWRVYEFKTTALTRSELILTCVEKDLKDAIVQNAEEIDFVDILDFGFNWFTSKDDATFEAEMRNEALNEKNELYEACSICGEQHPKNKLYTLAITVGFAGESIGHICSKCIDHIYPERELHIECECEEYDV